MEYSKSSHRRFLCPFHSVAVGAGGCWSAARVVNNDIAAWYRVNIASGELLESAGRMLGFDMMLESVTKCGDKVRLLLPQASMPNRSILFALLAAYSYPSPPRSLQQVTGSRGQNSYAEETQNTATLAPTSESGITVKDCRLWQRKHADLEAFDHIHESNGKFLVTILDHVLPVFTDDILQTPLLSP